MAAHALASLLSHLLVWVYAHTLVQCSFFVLCTRVFVCVYFHSCTMNGDVKIYDIGIGNIYLLNIYMLFFPILSSWSSGRWLELIQFAMTKFGSVCCRIFREVRLKKSFAHINICSASTLQHHRHPYAHAWYTPNQINNNSFECLSYVAFVLRSLLYVCMPFRFAVGVMR